MARFITPYSATVAVAVAAVMDGLNWGWLAIPMAVVYFMASRHCLKLMPGQTPDSNRHIKLSEQIGMAGMIAFLFLTIGSGIVAGLLVFVIFANLALNLQTYGKNQIYLGLVLSFTLITFSASESRDSLFILYFIPYSLFLCATLFCLNVEGLPLRFGFWLKSGALLLACTFIIYLLLPRFPALLLGGAKPGSDHFYHDDIWIKKAELDQSEKGEQPANDSNESAQQQEDTEATPGNESVKEWLENAENSEKHQGKSEKQSSRIKKEIPVKGSCGIDNRLRQNKNIVMQVRSDYPLYMTTEIFDTFDGEKWSKDNTSMRYIENRRDQFIDDATGQEKEGLFQVEYEVEIVEEIPARIPLAWQPAKLTFPAAVLRRDSHGNFQVPGVLKKGTAYGAAMQSRWQNGRLLYPAAEKDLEVYLALPEELDPRIQELAKTVVQEGNNSWEQAALLENHLRNNYAYTLDTMVQPPELTVAEFLFDTRYGHCEYFASAMAIMLRTMGIPSRVINGFAATDLNPLTGFIEVRGTDAHAWVEAYHEGYGWVPYEPTSYYRLPEKKTSQQLTYEKINEYVDRQLEILKVQKEKQSIKEWALNTWLMLVSAVSLIALTIKWLVAEYGVHLVALITTCLLLWMIYRHFRLPIERWWLERRVRMYRRKGTIDDYAFFIQAIIRKLELQGHSPCFSTIEDFANMLGRIGLDQQESAAREQFVNFFNLHAYASEHPEITRDHLLWLEKIFEGI